MIQNLINLLYEWRNTMPVQMIELDEVAMVELTDAALEATVILDYSVNTAQNSCFY